MPVRNVPFEKKLEVLKFYEENGYSIAQVCERFEVSCSAFKLWRKQYERFGIDGLKTPGAQKNYPPELKQAAIEDYLSGRHSILDVVLKYEISSTAVFRRWLKKYNGHGEVPRDRKGRGNSMTKGRKTTWHERIEIVFHCLAMNKDYQGTADQYGVSYNQVYQWVRKYETNGEDALKDRRGRKKDAEELTPEEKMKLEMKKLEKENQHLQAEVAFLKKLKELERRRS